MTDEILPPEVEGADRAPASQSAPEPLPPAPTRSAPYGQSEGAPTLTEEDPNYAEHWNSGQSGSGLSPKPTKWDKFKEGVDQQVHDSYLGTLLKSAQEKSVEEGTLVDPKFANQMNPYRTVPYTTPVDAGIVKMEAADGYRRQQQNEWLNRNDLGGFAHGAGQFVGGMVDLPFYMAVGAVTGGLADLAPAGGGLLGSLGRTALHYGATLADFSAVGVAQNKLAATMGDKEKSIPEVVGENVVPSAIMFGLGSLVRHFMDSGAATPEALQDGIKRNSLAMANDEKSPALTEQQKVLAERKAGVVQTDPNGNKIQPTVKTSPIEKTPLYAATHGDGSPLVHEHGLGEGTQFTDSYEAANNGVSRTTETPGQIGKSSLPGGAKLLDLDRTAAEDYHSKDSLLKAIEEKTGIPLENVTKSGETLKDILTTLHDAAGTPIGADQVVPKDIMEQIANIAKERGESGYLFQGENSRQVHMFDPNEAGMKLDDVQHADPSTTPELTSNGEPKPLTPEAAEDQEKRKAQNYDPNIQEKLNEIRKNAMRLHPDNMDQQIADTQEKLTDHKATLQALAKQSEEGAAPSASQQAALDALDELRQQEAHDKRMLAMAKEMIENCGSSG